MQSLLSSVSKSSHEIWFAVLVKRHILTLATHYTAAGPMPGEMFTLVVTKLISIREERPEVYALIKEETEWLIAYARVLGHNR